MDYNQTKRNIKGEPVELDKKQRNIYMTTARLTKEGLSFIMDQPRDCQLQQTGLRKAIRQTHTSAGASPQQEMSTATGIRM